MLSARPPKAEAEHTHTAAHSDQLASAKPSATVTFLHEWKLHVYRDQVRSASGGPRLPDVYDAWLSARMAV